MSLTLNYAFNRGLENKSNEEYVDFREWLQNIKSLTKDSADHEKSPKISVSIKKSKDFFIVLYLIKNI
jgi:hypothetical protein